MRIDPGNQGIPSVPGRKASRPGSSSTSRTSLDRSSTSAETTSLLAGLQELPEIRPEVIEEVRERLNRGEYLTREAAEKTAAAILADLVSFIGQ